MAKIKLDLQAVDNASKVIKKVAAAGKEAALKMISSDKAMSEATKQVVKQKNVQLTLSQKTKFAIEKEAAAGNRLKTALVKQKEALAKTEKALRQAIKAGDKNAVALAKETAKVRENVQALKKKSEAQSNVTMSAKGMAKAMAIGAAAVTAVGVATFLLTKKFADQNDTMIKTSQRLNLSVEDYQRLDFAMKISGTSIEEQKGALTRFARTARDASSGVKIAEEAFDALGVSVKNDAGEFKGMHELMLETSDRFKTMPASVEKTAISMDLFGRSGAALTQFLNLGSEGLREMGDEAASLGGVISEKAAKSSEEFIDALTRMQTATTGVSKSMSSEMEPMYTRAMNQIALSVGRLKEAYLPVFEQFKQSAIGWGKALVPVGVFIGKMFVALGSVLFKTWNGIKLVINGILAGVVGSFNMVIEGYNKVMSFVGKDSAEKLFNPFALSYEENINHINDITKAGEATFAELEKLGKAVLNTGQKRIDQTKEKIKQEGLLAQAVKDRGKVEEEVAQKTRRIVLEEFVVTGRRDEAVRQWYQAFPKLEEMSGKQALKFIETTKTQTAAAIELGNSIGDHAGQALTVLMDQSMETGEKMKAMFLQVVDIGRTAALAAISQYAASAAGAAYFSQAGIPIAGPAMAMAAAGVAFAAVTALAANMHEGGIVPGVGNTDSVPALLTPGELVIPKDLTSQILGVAGRSGSGRMAQGGIAQGGAGVVININEGQFMPRTPAEMDRFIRDKLVPSLGRLRRTGAFA